MQTPSPPQQANGDMLHKTLFVLIDGIGDVTLRSHCTQSAPEGRTPLQAASMAHCDHLAQHGLVGLLDSVEAGQACGSDTAHLSLLGYDPLLCYRGRGAFESLGAGMEMAAGDVAFKSNFATVDAHGVVQRRRADRAFPEWGLPLCESIDGATLPSFPDVRVSVRHATEHRVGVRLSGPNLSDCVSGTDPLVDRKPLRRCVATQDSADAHRTARIVEEVSAVFRRILSAHPINVERARQGLPVANAVLLRGAGARIAVPPFCQLHRLPGKAAMLAPTAIIGGLGLSVGFDLLPCPPDATGDYRSNLSSKARALLDAMTAPTSEYSFGFLHVKPVDDAGHDRDPARKVEWLRRSDAMVGEIVQRLREQKQGGAADTIWTIVVTGDHSTPVLYGDHSVEPVPFLACTLQHLPSFADVHYTPQIQSLLSSPSAQALRSLATQSNPVARFDEFACARGLLGRFPGRELMPLLCKLRAQMLGQGAAPVSVPQVHVRPLPHASDPPSSAPAQLQAHPVKLQPNL